MCNTTGLCVCLYVQMLKFHIRLLPSVCVYVCVCVCVHTRVCVRTHAYMHTCATVYVYPYTGDKAH